MLLCIRFILMVLLGVNVIAESIFTTVIETENGPVRGEFLSTIQNSVNYSSFKGIPYGEAPIADLRFKSPVKKRPWTNVLNATKEGNVCPQYLKNTSTVIGSEDCLYLNVFTPHTNFTALKKRDLKAVMVWIHGGGYNTGYSNSELYGPDYLVEEDVVIVSINYRLAALGFLNINHKNATGNAGLKDQNLALQWVKKNIAKFGGNPNKVTIFGQSSGAVSVDLHVLSQTSAGLFSKSIAMSGSPLCLYWGIQKNTEAEFNAFALGAKLGKLTSSKDELLQTLYNASVEDIIKKSEELAYLPFRPTIERTNPAGNQKKFLSECTVSKYISGNYNKGPHMAGFTSAETIAYTRIALLGVSTIALQFIKNASLPINIPILEKVTSLGVPGLSQLTQQDGQKLVEATSGLYYGTGIDTKQKLMSIHNEHPIYYYRFSYDSGSFSRSSGFDIKGVGHAEDVFYLFRVDALQDTLVKPIPQKMRKTYVRLFTNYAKYGNPTPNGKNDTVLQNINWPPSGASGLHLEINEQLSVGPRPTDANVKSYQSAGLGTSPILNDCI